MYCLKVSLCCIHWSPPSHFVKTGINGKRLRAGGCVRGGQDIVERALIFPFFYNARDASRVSRKSRIFWRLQNISRPGTLSRNTRFVPIPHACTQEVGETFMFRGKSEEGRRKERKRTRRKFGEGKWERGKNTRSSFLRDQGCSVIFFFLRGPIDPARPLDPQID